MVNSSPPIGAAKAVATPAGVQATLTLQTQQAGNEVGYTSHCVWHYSNKDEQSHHDHQQRAHL